jgi:hypothetical protein
MCIKCDSNEWKKNKGNLEDLGSDNLLLINIQENNLWR